MKRLSPECDATKRNGSTKTVFVACKLNNGLLLEVAEGTEKYQWARIRGSRATGLQRIAAVTEVPEDFWNKWKKDHDFMDCVRSGLIKAYPTREHAHASAFDNAAQLTGLEPMKGPDMPKGGDGEPLIEIDRDHLRKLGVAL